ncbi:MAG: hypothetical protein AAFV95_27750 [Bacteroidota bacterium]
MDLSYVYSVVLALCLPISAIGQNNYGLYHQLCNKADSLVYEKQYKAALETFEQAFNRVDYVHSNKYKDAYDLSIQMGDYEKAFGFGKMVLIHSGQPKYLKTKSRKFKKSTFFSLLQDSTSLFLEQYQKRINEEYSQLIDSLYFIDQRIVRKNKSVKGDWQIDEATLSMTPSELDSSNWVSLHQAIQQFGFPSEERVGREAHENAYIILLHNIRMKKNEAHHQEFIDYMKSGEYLPYYFYFWYEQYCTEVKGQTFFSLWDGDTSEENLKRIDLNRRKFYLKGVSSWKVRKGRRRYRPKEKW